MQKPLVVIAVLGMLTGIIGARAEEQTTEGSYHTPRSQGTYQKRVDRHQGSITKSTNWHNEKGSGNISSSKKWDRRNGAGQSEHAVTSADGRTAQQHREVQRNADGSYTTSGDGTDFNQRNSTVNRHTSAVNDDGVQSVHTVRKRDDGKSLNTDANIKRTDNGLNANGTYQTGEGKSGTFESQSINTDTGQEISQTITDAQGKTVRRDVKYTKSDNGVERDVTYTGPDGETRSRSSDYNRDSNTPN